MKGILILSLLGVFAAGQAQVIQLEETKINYSPRAVVVSADSGKLILNVAEEYKGQFSNDPIKFMNDNFNIFDFKKSQKEKYDSYLVDFRSNKGHLLATFDRNGELVKTYQRFKNCKMPVSIRQEIFQNNKGWSIVNYKYFATGKSDKIDKETYTVHLVSGKEKKTLKIHPERATKIASN